MLKRLLACVVVCLLLTPTLNVRADVIMPPYLPGSDGFPIFLLVVGLIIALIVGLIVLIRIFKKRK